MRRLPLIIALVGALLSAGAAASASQTVGDPDAGYVRIDDSARTAVVGNALVERTIAWEASGAWTTSLVDKRTGREWLGIRTPLFTYSRGPAGITSDAFQVVARAGEVTTAGGALLRMRMTSSTWTLTVIREIEVLPGVAGFASRTTLQSPVPFQLDRYTLDEVGLAGTGLAAHAVDLRAGPEWSDPARDHKADTVFDATGEGTAEWMDVRDPAGAGVVLLMERRAYFSSVMRFAAGDAAALVDTRRDYQYLANGSFGTNPWPVGRYTRTVNGSLDLEPAFLGLGTGADDIPWQAFKYLRSRMRWKSPTVDFNTDRIDHNLLTSGYKDDADALAVAQIAPIVQRLGVETFILDDGWQPHNGDWWPDPDRFPSGFEPIVADLRARGMRLGLWLAPGNYHPDSQTFRANPEWTCTPVGTATGAVNAVPPASDAAFGGLTEAGIGMWNMAGLNRYGEIYADHARSVIEGLVERYDIAKFKFDFLAWNDCVGAQTVDAYQDHDAFFDRVIHPLVAAHPDVGFGLDETQDYRGFPYESILGGPVWFDNNGSQVSLLHNVWTLAPYVPGWALGQNALNTEDVCNLPIDTLAVMSMVYQPTIRTDVRQYSSNPASGCTLDDVVAKAGPWISLYKRIRPGLATMTYPLLRDPSEHGWTAFQPWDADAQSGYVLAFRQQDANGSADVALRGLVPGASYEYWDVTPSGDGSHAALTGNLLPVSADLDGFRLMRVQRTG